MGSAPLTCAVAGNVAAAPRLAREVKTVRRVNLLMLVPFGCVVIGSSTYNGILVIVAATLAWIFRLFFPAGGN
jgi:hypothetical protein